MRNKAYRRHQSKRHMDRRLKEDRNQHYNDLNCPCLTDKKAMARFKEQPATCNRIGCCNHQHRKAYGRTIQELRNGWK